VKARKARQPDIRQSTKNATVPDAAGTSPIELVPTGEIVGFWTDTTHNQHGFIRGRNGGFTKFDVTGAISTGVSGCNTAGTIVGSFTDASGIFHGYLRSDGGAVTTFDLADAGKNAGQGTFAGNVNSAGTIAGYYVDNVNVAHGFTGTPGNFSTFDAPGSVSTYMASVDAFNQ
jgi:hypothetical protein